MKVNNVKAAAIVLSSLIGSLMASPIPISAPSTELDLVKRCCGDNDNPVFVMDSSLAMVHTPTDPSTHIYVPPETMKMEGYSAVSKGHAPASSLPAPIRSEKVQHLRPSTKMPLSDSLKMQPL